MVQHTFLEAESAGMKFKHFRTSVLNLVLI